MWATRAGNVFTTHTPVTAGFDRFPLKLLGQYRPSLTEAGIEPAYVLALGRADEEGNAEPLSMAYLAARGALSSFGVSRLHGNVSHRIFQSLFPRWPEHEVPVGYVTNGVHVPSWDSPAADEIWTGACGKDRWRSMPDDLPARVAVLSDDTLWAMRGKARQSYVEGVRARLERQFGGRGHPPEAVALARSVLDPNVLTLGFARRFTGYKRPNLLLRDRGRFERILNNEQRPAQIVVAGKVHPADEDRRKELSAGLRPPSRVDLGFVRCRHRCAFRHLGQKRSFCRAAHKVPLIFRMARTSRRVAQSNGAVKQVFGVGHAQKHAMPGRESGICQ
jgi:starch phosphorylase